MMDKYGVAAVESGLVTNQGARETSIYKNLDYGQIMVARYNAEMSLAYRQEPGVFIADEWFPLYDAQFISGLVPKWSKENAFTDYVGTWRPGTPLPQADLKIDDPTTYVCQRYACEIPMADDIPFVADPGIDPTLATTNFLTDVMQLHKERLIADAYFQSEATGGDDVWATNLTGVTTGENNTTTFRRVDDYANSDPRLMFKNLKLILKTLTGVTPNTVLMGEQVFEALRIHPQLIQWYQTGANTIKNITELNEAALAQALGIDKIMVGRSMYNTAKPGDTVSLSWIFGKHMWVGYVDTPGPMKPLAGVNFSYNKPLGGFDTAFTTVPDLRTKAEFYQAFQCFSQKIIGDELGAMIATIIS